MDGEFGQLGLEDGLLLATAASTATAAAAATASASTTARTAAGPSTAALAVVMLGCRDDWGLGGSVVVAQSILDCGGAVRSRWRIGKERSAAEAAQLSQL